MKVRSTNEVGVLAYDINSMIDKIEEMTSDVVNTQSRLYEAEISKNKRSFLPYKVKSTRISFIIR